MVDVAVNGGGAVPAPKTWFEQLGIKAEYAGGDDSPNTGDDDGGAVVLPVGVDSVVSASGVPAPDSAAGVGGAPILDDIPNTIHTPLLGRFKNKLSDYGRKPWVYGKIIMRKKVTLLIAPGGVGKSNLLLSMAASIVSGKDILGIPVHGGPKRVWTWNLEDDADLIDENADVARITHGLSIGDVADRWHISSGPDHGGVCAVTEGKDGYAVNDADRAGIVAHCRAKAIDVLIVDPLVSTHSVSENDNTAIQKVAAFWRDIAMQAECAVVLVHHSKKADGREMDMDSARGASALTGAVRIALALNPMNKDEAKEYGITKHEMQYYVRLAVVKNNVAAHDRDRWFKKTIVCMGNGTGMTTDPNDPDAHETGMAMMPWTPPRRVDGVNNEQITEIQYGLRDGVWLMSGRGPASKNWAGIIVADVVGLDISGAGDKKKAKVILDDLVAQGYLEVSDEVDDYRNKIKVVSAGKDAGE